MRNSEGLHTALGRISFSDVMDCAGMMVNMQLATESLPIACCSTLPDTEDCADVFS